MFIPTVPSVPHTRVINQTIVYSDTVLSLKELGENLKVTSISNITEQNLEKCLKTIFESNQNIMFNTVQYSKNKKKLYFYTDKEISTKTWEENKYKIYNPLESSQDILEEIKNILTSEKNLDPNCISLYDVLNLTRKKYNEYNQTTNLYETRVRNIIKSHYNSSLFILYGFKPEKEELNIGFSRLGNDWGDIYFSKKDGDLYVKKSNSAYDQKLLEIAGDSLSILYDKLMDYKDFIIQYNYWFNAINTNFSISISHYNIGISIYGGDFALSASSSGGYDYRCNSNKVLSSIKGNELEIFKRVYVRIEDCPEWSRTTLYETRKNQLEEEKRIEEERKQQEEKKQKKLALKRKLFPFLKK